METTGSLKSHHTTAFVELSSAVHSKLSVVGVSDVPTDRGRLRCLNPPNDLSLERILSATKRLFMDSELRFVPPCPRWTRCCGSSTWEGISASPGPHQQGKVTAMSGHMATMSDPYVEVLGTQFILDADHFLCEYDHGPRSLAKPCDLPLDKSGLRVYDFIRRGKH